MDKRNLKAQAAMEFMLLTAFLVLIFAVMMGIISGKTTDINKKREVLQGEDIVIKIQKEINLAVRVSDGYYRQFYLPQQVGYREYNVYLEGNDVVVRTARRDFWRTIPDIVGNITKGYNIINKTNGTIYLN